MYTRRKIKEHGDLAKQHFQDVAEYGDAYKKTFLYERVELRLAIDHIWFTILEKVGWYKLMQRIDKKQPPKTV